MIIDQCLMINQKSLNIDHSLLINILKYGQLF